MRIALHALCFVAVCGYGTVAWADPDYYEATASADAAAKARKFETAAQALEAALRKYPGDYVLTLKLAWMEFQRERYSEAERLYRLAIELSDGSLDSRVGLGWALIQQDRCDEGVEILKGVLAEEASAPGAHQGLKMCHRRSNKRPHAARGSRARR